MLTSLHTLLQNLLYTQAGAHTGLDPLDVDIRFDAPTKDFSATLTKPTISFFLFDLKENTDKGETSPQTLRANGRASTHMPPRRMDLCFMVSVLTTEVQDEHNLLWRVAATLMRYREFPSSALPAELRDLEPPITARLHDKESGRGLIEIWNGLGSPPRPSLYYVVTAPMDLEAALEAPLVLTRKIDYLKIHADEVVASRTYDAARYRSIQGVLRNNLGQPVQKAQLRLPDGTQIGETDAQGRFILRDLQPGVLTLHISIADQHERRAALRVPAASYDIVIDRVIEGVVRDEAGLPVKNVIVQGVVGGAVDGTQLKLGESTTNAQGQFALSGVTMPDEVTLVLKQAEKAEQEIKLQLPALSYDLTFLTDS